MKGLPPCSVAGWGQHTLQNNEKNEYLKYAYASYITKIICQHKLEDKFELQDGMFCAAMENMGPCEVLFSLIL